MQGSFLGGLLDGGATTVALLIGVGLFVLVAALFAMLLLSRRQHGREVREIVHAVEEIRGGHHRRRAEIDPASPLADISDAVHRLGQDLHVRLRDAKGAREKLSAIIDSARDLAIITADADGDVRSFSPGAVSMFGWDDSSIGGRSLSVLFEPDSWSDFMPKLNRRGLRDHPVETSAVMRRREGADFEARVVVRALPAPGADAPGFLLVVSDTTRRSRLEAELRASEERYRGLVERLDSGVFLQRGGVLLYANPAMAQLCGSQAESLQDVPLRERVETGDLLLFEEALGAVERGERDDAELSVALRAGHGGPGPRVRLRLMRVPYGGEAAVLGMLADETEERRVEAELRRNEGRLDAVLEATPDGVLVTATTAEGGVVLMTNHAFLRLFDLAEREVLGASEGELLRLLRERSGGAEAVAAFLAASEGGARRETVTLQGPRGGDFELLVRELAGRDAGRLGRILVCRDRSAQGADRRELQTRTEELQQSRRALERAYKQLESMSQEFESRTRKMEKLNRELRTLDEMKTNLLGNVTHDLQMPLVSVRGYTEMMLKGRLGEVNEEQRRGLNESLKNIDRLISMIDSLLAFSRMSREAGSLDLSTFPLEPVVDEALALVAKQRRAKGIEISRVFEPRGLRAHGDREMILRVFTNLLSNAIKFNREGGDVHLVVRAGKPGFVEVSVRDSGIGIPEHDRERIFERHYRSPTAPKQAEGSGLGLAIVREILQLHGCSIKVQSELGRGSTFHFTLPAEREQQRTDHPDAPSVSGAETGPAREPEPPAPDGDGPAGGGQPPRPRLRIIRRAGR